MFPGVNEGFNYKDVRDAGLSKVFCIRLASGQAARKLSGTLSARFSSTGWPTASFSVTRRWRSPPGRWPLWLRGKGLLDLIHLMPGADSPEYLTQLRLQNLQAMNMSMTMDLALRSRKPKWIRAAGLVGSLLDAERGESL
jgi:hypothetical protein